MSSRSGLRDSVVRAPFWSISKSWAIEPPTGDRYDAAYIVRLEDEAGSTHDLVVEFEAPSALTCVGYADEIAHRFWRDAEPPTHVRVDVKRRVRIVGEGRRGVVADSG
jgi:hypothetical protein